MAKNRTETSQKSLKDVKIWYRDDYVKRNGTALISLFLYLKGERVIFNTNISVSPDFWDYEKKVIKKSHPHAKDYNMIIDTCKGRINEIFVRYRLQHKELTPDLLKKEYITPSTYIDFYEFMERAIIERKDELEKSTIRQHKAALSKLKSFKKSLMFSEIDEKFILRYRIYLIRKYKNKLSTVYNSLSRIKAYLNIAKKEGIINNNPFDRVKLVKSVSEREYLTEEELQSLIALYNKKYLPGNYQKVLRHYLFACVTSLRISDLRVLKMEQIINNILVYFPVKTKKKKPKAVKIPLKKLAWQLIRDESPNRLSGTIFNMYADPTTNRMLKDIIKEAGIKKDITFHSARHTFATYFLRKTKNILVLRGLLGHSDIKETMIYSHLLSEDLIAEMEVFDNL
ncbi:Tyrosine recombinase XerC [subsurface metagenome]